MLRLLLRRAGRGVNRPVVDGSRVIILGVDGEAGSAHSHLDHVGVEKVLA